MYGYDLVVIGSGPGGQKAVIAGTKSVAVVERRLMVEVDLAAVVDRKDKIVDTIRTAAPT
jgi:thioredoxin reductase